MEDLFVKQLNNLGLKTKEARIYLALLKLKEGAVSDICKEANVNRTTGHYILVRLYLLNIVGRIYRGKRKIYIAESPNLLKRHIEERKIKADRDLKILNEILPELDLLHNKERVVALSTVGEKKDIREIIREKLRGESGVYSILNLGSCSDGLDEYMKEYLKERLILDTRVKVLAGINCEGPNFLKILGKDLNFLKNSKNRCRFIDCGDSLCEPFELNVCEDKLVGVVFRKDNIAFELENEYFVRLIKNVLEIMWRKAEKIV